MSAMSGVRLIGGELVAGSDLGGVLPGGAAVTALLGRAVPAGSRVLLCGPHEERVLEWLLDRRAHVSYLVRSLPDAQEIALRRAEDEELAVLCGGLAKMEGEGPFDAVIAAGGLTRLNTPDSSPLTWAESLEVLTGLLAENGRMLLTADNGFGVHRLADPDPETAENWQVEQDPTLPGDLEDFASRLGVGSDRCFAAYPGPFAPTLLLGTERLGDFALAGVLVARSLGVRYARTPVLFDPGEPAVRALRQGRGADFAPGWLAVTGPEPLPSGLAVEGHGAWSVPVELHRAREGWERLPLSGEAGAAGLALRDPALLAGPVPGGRLLEDELVEACARGDLPALRASLRAYAAWLDGQPSPAFATPRDVVFGGEGFEVLDPSWDWAEPVPAGLALARSMWLLAHRLCSGGLRHPWPATLDLTAIATTLLAMAGRPEDRIHLREAVLLEAAITAVREELSPAGQSRLAADLEEGASRTIPSHRDALIARRRALAELEESLRRTDWLNTALLEREAELRDLRTELAAAKKETAAARRDLARVKDVLAGAQRDLKAVKENLRTLRGSRSFKMGRLATAPARAVRRVRP
ncbi:hypothetical protein [Actinocorallia longicatena]|uniref:Uncharacterized protein n=1 Tax=Actinocorallia longicatena TaxID=111803 RepID=A0ABP6QGH4_9ACTN